MTALKSSHLIPWATSARCLPVPRASLFLFFPHGFTLLQYTGLFQDFLGLFFCFFKYFPGSEMHQRPLPLTNANISACLEL